MTLPAPTYDLMLLLDPQAEEPARTKLVADARAAIEAQGELLRHDEWGDRALAYPIDRRTVAEYHLLQFHAGTPELLGTLNRTLRIADDILRFRIIKLRPGVPEAPEMQTAGAQRADAEPEGVAGDAPEVEVDIDIEIDAPEGAPAESADEPAIQTPAEVEPAGEARQA